MALVDRLLESKMNKVIPKILIGKSLVLLSETVSFPPELGLKFSVPTFDESKQQSGPELFFEFIFDYDSAKPPGGMKPELVNDGTAKGVKIFLTNFGSSLPSGLTHPLSFNIGTASFSLLFGGHLLVNDKDSNFKMLTMTVSVFQGVLK